MPIQAYVDDSGSHKESLAFVLAGFIANHVQWEKFTGDWKGALRLDPSLDYFKMNEAASLHGQFLRAKGWDEEKRDKRLDVLSEVILSYVRVRISVSMRNDDFLRSIQSLPAPKRSFAIDGPFIMLAMQLILTVAVFSDLSGLNEPCDFVFDETDGFSEEFLLKWPMFKHIADQQPRLEFGKKIGQTPIFRDEKYSMPLQAADMYAWNVRENFVLNKTIYMPPPRVIKRLGSISAINRHMDSAEIDRLRDHLVKVGELYWNQNPTHPKERISATKRERQRARKKKFPDT